MPRFYRRVIKVTAEDSPNVRYARAEMAVGKVPSNKIILPGILPWEDYQKRRQLWDKVLQCIGLDAEFYEGAEVLLYPPEWLNRAEAFAEQVSSRPRKVRAIGIDPAEGGDKTVMCAIDEWGIVEMISKKTPDTSVITGDALAFMMKHNVEPSRVVFDRGGGGKEHADRLRAQGHNVRTVAFGEAPSGEAKRGMPSSAEVLDNKEQRYAYLNRRAEMYDTLRHILDPGNNRGSDIWTSIATLTGKDPEEVGRGFGIPREYTDLRRQLAPIPLLFDGEGRLYLPPKTRKNPQSKTRTLQDIIGQSPDEADALVLAVHILSHKRHATRIGAMK